MTKWNEIPFDEDADAQTEADEFDAQYAESYRDAPEDDSNPYSKEKFDK